MSEPDLAPNLANAAQLAHWNDRTGDTWSELADLLDKVLAPFADLLVETIAPAAGCRLLDVGCGAGAVTTMAATAAGPGGSCLGVDISAQLIATATARARAQGIATAHFAKGDAQTFAFDSGSFDAIVSRFGVMFFDDPIAAFRNLHKAARPDGLLAVVTWRGPNENPFMLAAEQAAADALPEPLPPRSETGPGQFGFADPARVTGILAAAGWRDIDINPVDRVCAMSREELHTYVTRMGPLGTLLPTLDPEVRAEVVRRLDAAFQSYVEGDTARFTAACWQVTARA